MEQYQEIRSRVAEVLDLAEQAWFTAQVFGGHTERAAGSLLDDLRDADLCARAIVSELEDVKPVKKEA